MTDRALTAGDSADVVAVAVFGALTEAVGARSLRVGVLLPCSAVTLRQAIHAALTGSTRRTPDGHLSALLADVPAPEHGAVIVFLGIVRCDDGGRAVTGMTYDAFVPLAARVLSEIVRECVTMWGPTLAVLVVHRVGPLAIGETSVAIVVAAPHRAEAYDASRYVIEQIKRRTPIWKQEHYTDGDSAWLPGTPLHPDDTLA